MGKHFQSKTMSQSSGRPLSERFDSADLAFVKERISQVYPTLVSFYDEFYNEASALKFKGHRQPEAVESVSSAFVKFFGGVRALPGWYWIILKDLIGLTKSDLPSMQPASEAKGFTANAELKSAAKKRKSNKPLIPGMVNQNATTSNAKTITDRRDLSLPERVRAEPLLSTRRTLLAAEAKQGANKPSIGTEILEPECITVFTEKLASDSVCDLDLFWCWETRKENRVFEILDAVFLVMAADRDSRVRFIQNMASWLPKQSAERKFDYILSLASMCGHFESLNAGGLVQDFDQVIANSIETISPKIAKTSWICPCFETLLHKFVALEYCHSPIAVVSLLSKNNYHLAKEAIKKESHFDMKSVWKMIESCYGRAIKEKIKPNDPFYQDHCLLLNFHKFLTRNAVIKQTSKRISS